MSGTVWGSDCILCGENELQRVRDWHKGTWEFVIHIEWRVLCVTCIMCHSFSQHPLPVWRYEDTMTEHVMWMSYTLYESHTIRVTVKASRTLESHVCDTKARGPDDKICYVNELHIIWVTHNSSHCIGVTNSRVAHVWHKGTRTWWQSVWWEWVTHNMSHTQYESHYTSHELSSHTLWHKSTRTWWQSVLWERVPHYMSHSIRVTNSRVACYENEFHIMWVTHNTSHTLWVTIFCVSHTQVWHICDAMWSISSARRSRGPAQEVDAKVCHENALHTTQATLYESRTLSSGIYVTQKHGELMTKRVMRMSDTLYGWHVAWVSHLMTHSTRVTLHESRTLESHMRDTKTRGPDDIYIWVTH